MRNCFILLVLVITIKVFCEIKVIYPNGGESFTRGEKINVLWTDDSAEDYVQINYSDSSGICIVTFYAENTGSYEWTVPSHTFGDNFKIIVESKVNGTDWDQSDENFSIKKGSITITTPVAGETVEMIKNYSIKWSDDIIENVKIYLYKDTQQIRTFLAGNEGYYEWVFYTDDLVHGSDYKIKVVSTTLSDVYDETEFFTIKGTNEISGSLYGVWDIANSPYIITDSAYIETDKTLKIDPGVRLIGIQAKNILEIKGQLLAAGLYDNKISFEDIVISVDNSSCTDSAVIKYTDLKKNYNQEITEISRTYGGALADQAMFIETTSDGGYIITGGTSSSGAGDLDAWLIKTDKYGKMEWDNTYGGTELDRGHCVRQCIDGGFILTGPTFSYGDAATSIWLIKTDKSGNEEWSKTFGITGQNIGTSVIQNTDGGFTVAGTKFGTGGYDAWLIKTDTNGEEIWNRTYSTDNMDAVYSLVQTSDNGYILAGYTGINEERDWWIIKTDPEGIEEWNKMFGGAGNDIAYSILELDDGGFLAAGLSWSHSNGGADVCLLKLDADGNEEFNRNYGGESSELAKSVQKTADGGYIICGTTYELGTSDLLIMKLDSNFNTQWEKIYGGEYIDSGSSVIQDTESNIVAVGDTFSYGNGLYDLWLIKTDEGGNDIPGSCYISVNDNSKAVIQNCTIQNLNDYGIIVNNASPVISNNLITGNSGGIKLSGSSSRFVVNNTISDNGSIGIWFEGNSDVSCINNIIYGNGIYQVFLADDEADPSFYYNDIQGGLATFGTGWGVIYSGSYENNIDADPLFIDSGYEIFVNSSCFNSGMPDLDENDLIEMNIPLYDIAGNQRIRLDRIDIGSFETYEVGIEENNMPLITELYQNYPNPFNPSTEISYSLMCEGMVTLSVFNSKGELISTLVNETRKAGNHSVKFNGEGLNSGIYFYKLEVNGITVDSKRMLLIK